MAMQSSRTAGDVEVPVLIAGGGLIGLATAMFLAQHGIRSELRPMPSGRSLIVVSLFRSTPASLAHSAIISRVS